MRFSPPLSDSTTSPPTQSAPRYFSFAALRETTPSRIAAEKTREIAGISGASARLLVHRCAHSDEKCAVCPFRRCPSPYRVAFDTCCLGSRECAPAVQSARSARSARALCAPARALLHIRVAPRAD